MSSFFKTIGRRYNNYMLRVGRQQAREVLLRKSARELHDIGLSRELLEQGVDSWPWTVDATTPAPAPAAPPRKVSRREELRAIRSLQAMSNRELNDLGISRGAIIDAVLNGRPADRKASIAAVAKKRATADVISRSFVPGKAAVEPLHSDQNDRQDDRQAA